MDGLLRTTPFSLPSHENKNYPFLASNTDYLWNLLDKQEQQSYAHIFTLVIISKQKKNIELATY